MTKCYLCGEPDAHLHARKKPVCRKCKAHWEYDRALIRDNGVLALPIIYVRAIVRRFMAGSVRCINRLRNVIYVLTGHPKKTDRDF